ncbi:MAG TPA: neutral zinc metallopeptidase [Thermoleophilia bacterium]|nr:neutral zinc metallopeptidase [Thermoleophilia bacterium]
MRWRGRRGSGNVEDRRGSGRISPRGTALGGVGGVGVVIILLLIILAGGDPTTVVNQQGVPQDDLSQSQQDESERFVSVVLADTEDVWGRQFRQMDREYRQPTLVLYTGYVSSACGTTSSAVGPFYCPIDEKIYLDLKFFQELRDRFGAPGDFAAAYVIAHEVGHHIQNQLGIMDAVSARQQRVSQAEANRLSVRLELQADFLAGVWAHNADKSLGVVEAGDIAEALTAADAIGDDRLQMESRGFIVPDSFTHGTSAQRMHWFRLGYETGDLSRGDTFSRPSLQLPGG